MKLGEDYVKESPPFLFGISLFGQGKKTISNEKHNVSFTDK